MLAVRLGPAASIQYDLSRVSYRTANELYRKFETNIPRNETARPRFLFLHSCTVPVSDLHIPVIGLFILLQQKGGPIVGIYKSLSDT